MKTKAVAGHLKGILLLLGILVAAVCVVVFFSIESAVHLSSGNVGDAVKALLPDSGTLFASQTLTSGGDHALVQLK